MELLAKFRDAASMFWASLDSQERFMVAYFAASMLLSAMSMAARKREERLVQRVREEFDARV